MKKEEQKNIAEAILGRFGVVLGGLGGCLGALGGAWGRLGRSWGPLGGVGRHGFIFVVFSSTGPGERVQWAPKREPTWHPKWKQKRTKIDVKNDDEK